MSLILPYMPGSLGGASAWLPTTPSGLLCWHDMSDMSTLFQTTDESTPVTAAGQKIGRVNDKSGNGKYRTRSTLAERPSFITTGFGGTKSCAYIDSGCRMGDTGNPAVTSSQPVTMFVACRPNGTLSTPSICYGNYDNICLQMYKDFGHYIYAGAYHADFVGGVPSVTAIKIMCGVANNGSDCKLFVNGTTDLLAGTSIGTKTFALPALWSPVSGGFTFNFAEWGEGFAYAGVLSNADIVAGITYLNAKWGGF